MFTRQLLSTPSAAPAILFTTVLASCGGSRPPPPVSTTQTTSSALAPEDPDAFRRMGEAAQVLVDGVGDDGTKIPEVVALRTQCVGVIPGLVRGGRVTAGQQAGGVVTCRTANGWSKPGFFVATASAQPLRVDSSVRDVVILSGDAAGKGAFFDVAPAHTTHGGQAAAGRIPFVCYGHDGAGAFSGVELGGMFIKPDPTAIRTYYRRDRAIAQLLNESAGDVPDAATFTAIVAKAFDRLLKTPED